MGVPAEIRAVPRPKNTVVVDSGRDTVNRYAVMNRKGIKYIPNHNPQPQNGKVIGHIIDFTFVPIPIKQEYSGPFELQYGATALIKKLTQDVYYDLLKVFNSSHATSIFVIAALKVIYEDPSSVTMSTLYNETFLSKFYPGAPLSKNFISDLYEKIGMDDEKREQFYNIRLKRVEKDHNVVVDGTLKENNSKINDLSAFSYKSKIKSSKYISILYAYDIEEDEPVCAQVFPGNKIDSSSLPIFLKSNNITKGLLIGDKGFTKKQLILILKNHPDLHYMFPIKNNDKRIKKYNMTCFDGIIKGIRDIVYYKKVKDDNLYLYSFRNQSDANDQANAYGNKNKNDDTFDSEKYEKKYSLFGVIVFESDIDIDPKIAYKSYANRWMIELVFKKYKNDIDLSSTNVHANFSVIGSEFVNFISVLMTCRIVHLLEKKCILDEMSYGSALTFLRSSWRKIDAPVEASTDDGYWWNTNDNALKLLEKLDLSKPEPKPEPKKRGRPRKESPAEQAPKRPVGRPRKNPAEEPQPKRPVGRPRKSPKEEPRPKRPVGRPRKNPVEPPAS